MNPFLSCMVSYTGRIVRAAAGIVLLLWGWLGLGGAKGGNVVLIRLASIAAGIFNICLLAPLFGVPLSGSRIRSGK
ncbi:MAG: DUF2892 domain-containing protein [Anaerolineales bacterium]|nr:DUF2892 domain-containing protein [Anaerolineales bacterium]